jgi:hypothetical protein
MRDRRHASALLVGTALAIAAPAAGQSQAECRTCGRVESIRVVTSSERWEPLGSAVGTNVPAGGPGDSMQPAAVSSFRIGAGGRNEGMVLLGSAGGANYKKSSGNYEQRRWEVMVKLDDGQTRSVSLRYDPYVREGDRVRIAGNNVELLE